jgi:coenzyme PQQ precursor peptide PqqA
MLPTGVRRILPAALGLPVSVSVLWRIRMTWETPRATDIRFGFEITMYVAAR